MRKAVLAACLMLLAAACGPGAMPPPSAPEYAEVVAALVLRGARVTTQVGGDAGCDEPALSDNAVRLDVVMGGAPAVPVYLFQWRRGPDFEAEADEFARCAAATSASSVVEHVPWRAHGRGWSTSLEQAVRAALDADAAAPTSLSRP